MVLQGNALTWFTQLVNIRRSTLVTWKDWQKALHNAFYLPNHKSALRRQCLHCTLQTTESFSDHFQGKEQPQHYVYPEGTDDFEFLEDVLEGILQTLGPVITASINHFTTLERFGRFLIDLELELCNTLPKHITPSTGTAPPYNRP
jgi:hypothetical protein